MVSQVLHRQLHPHVPRTLLQPPSQLPLTAHLHESTVLRHRDASAVGLAAPEPHVAVAGLDFLAEHVGPEELALVGAELTLGEGGQVEDGENSEAVLDLHVLVVVHALAVAAAAHHAQTLHPHPTAPPPPLAPLSPLSPLRLLFCSIQLLGKGGGD